MRHKVAELEGALLDAAVAKAEGYPSAAAVPAERRGEWWDEARDTGGYFGWRPSSLWHQAGQIIERERISVFQNGDGSWSAMMPQAHEDDDLVSGTGQTPLIAAMRAFVASKFGEWVELP